MSYEINIVSINQTKPTRKFQKSPLLVLNEMDSEFAARYFEIWPVFSNMKGIQYTIVEEVAGKFLSARPFCDSDFEAVPVNIEMFSYLPDSTKYYLTPLIIKDEYLSDLKSIISTLIEGSPVKTIAFQTRYQGGDYEVITGSFGIKDFFNKLENKEILFNVCYLVHA